MGRAPVVPVEKRARIVLSVLAGEMTIAEAARRERVGEQLIGRWKADSPEAVAVIDGEITVKAPFTVTTRIGAEKAKQVTLDKLGKVRVCVGFIPESQLPAGSPYTGSSSGFDYITYEVGEAAQSLACAGPLILD